MGELTPAEQIILGALALVAGAVCVLALAWVVGIIATVAQAIVETIAKFVKGKA